MEIWELVDEPRPGEPPFISAARVSDDGQELGVFVTERDGTVSAITITVKELAD